MSRIFISYRSTDVSNATTIHRSLIEAFGNDQVMIDRTYFVPGADWLQQIRANIAAAECIVIVLGESWNAESARKWPTSAKDYVLAELNLARALGKVIIPAIVGISTKEINSNIPVTIDWIKKLHFVRCEATDQVNSSLVGAIENMIGKRSLKRRNGGGASWENVAEIMRAGAFRLVKGFRHPFGTTATSVRPTTENIAISTTQLLIAIALLLLGGIALGGSLTIYTLSKLSALVSVISVSALIAHQLTHHLSKASASLYSSLSFAFHVASLIVGSFGLLCLILFATTSEPVRDIVLSGVETDYAFETQVRVLQSTLTNSAQVTLVIIFAGFALHFAHIVTGVIRAVAVSLGPKPWWAPAVFFIVYLAMTLTASFYLDGGDGIRRENLPMHVRLGWTRDTLTDTGVTRAPLLLALVGTITKEENSIVFAVTSFAAENRAVANLHLLFVECGLRVIKGAQSEWTEPFLSGRLNIDKSIEVGESIRIEDKRIKIPLIASTTSGHTSISCFVHFPSGAYPVGNGVENILRW